MKDLHARTHGFVITVINGSLKVGALPIDEFDEDYFPLAFKDNNIFDHIRDAETDDWGTDRGFSLRYETADYYDAIFALFALVHSDHIDLCDANDAAMKFTEAFYGMKTE